MGGGEAILAAGGAALKGAKVQIGAEAARRVRRWKSAYGLCKGGNVDDKITEYRGRKDAKTVQR